MILLTSTEYIKAHSGLNDNTYDKMLNPAIVRAQDLDLTEALGDCLVAALQDKVSSGDINLAENALYKVLLDNYVQPFLTYTALGNITLEIGQVMGNGGIDFLTDDHRTSLSFDERSQVKDYWLHHADAYKLRMLKFLRNNSSAFPEWTACCKSKDDLSSACSVWFGGTRGKIIPKDCCK